MPVVGESMFHLAEHGIDVLLLVFPVGAWVGGAWQVQVVAIRTDRQTAPEKVGPVFLTGETQGCRGVLAQVSLAHRVEQTMVAVFLITKSVGVTVGAYYPSTQGPTVVERA
ncbi:hypothetical protein D3C85_1485240 [compost metagenome]